MSKKLKLKGTAIPKQKPIYLRRLRNYNPQAVDGMVSKMRYQDLQRACIVRGMPFELLVEGDYSRLHSWLAKHYSNDVVKAKLDEFDMWREGIMRARGVDEPFIRLGYIAEQDELTGEILKRKKLRNIKEPVKKRERNKELGNIYSGTKKELTFKCQKEGKSIEQTITIVKEKFPEAVEKSIRIWYKRQQRAK